MAQLRSQWGDMLPKWLHFLIFFQFLGVMGEEIVIQDSADSFQVPGVNGAFGEYLVYIGTVTRQSGGKPYYCFALLLKSILYQLTYVHLQCKCFQGSPNPEFFI